MRRYQDSPRAAALAAQQKLRLAPEATQAMSPLHTHTHTWGTKEVQQAAKWEEWPSEDGSPSKEATQHQ